MRTFINSSQFLKETPMTFYFFIKKRKMNQCKRVGKRPILERRWWTDKDRYFVDYLLTSPAYHTVETYREQCHVMHDILVRSLGCSNNYCAKLLNVDHKSFDKQV